MSLSKHWPLSLDSFFYIVFVGLLLPSSDLYFYYYGIYKSPQYMLKTSKLRLNHLFYHSGYQNSISVAIVPKSNSSRLHDVYSCVDILPSNISYNFTSLTVYDNIFLLARAIPFYYITHTYLMLSSVLSTPLESNGVHLPLSLTIPA